jgi:hypothetical protein
VRACIRDVGVFVRVPTPACPQSLVSRGVRGVRACVYKECVRVRACVHVRVPTPECPPVVGEPGCEVGGVDLGEGPGDSPNMGMS